MMYDVSMMIFYLFSLVKKDTIAPITATPMIRGSISSKILNDTHTWNAPIRRAPMNSSPIINTVKNVSMMICFNVYIIFTIRIFVVLLFQSPLHH